jgi:twitching motility protein PilT
VLVVTPAIRALIREDKTHQIYSSMQAGTKFGMQTMNQSLYAAYLHGVITKEAMIAASEDPNELERMVGQSGMKGGR